MTHNHKKVFAINGLLNGSKSHVMAWYGIKLHVVALYRTNYWPHSMAYYNIYIHISMHNFPTRNMLHIWTIHVTYLNDLSYVSGRFVFCTGTYSHASVWTNWTTTLFQMACHGIIGHGRACYVHCVTKYQSRSIMKYSTYKFISQLEFVPSEWIVLYI